MDYKDWSSKLENVLERVDKDTLYDFITAYARTHEDFALLLVNEFWQAEKDDYHSMVQQCLMHPSPAGTKNGDGYDWVAEEIVKENPNKAFRRMFERIGVM